jgi:hypothetical protein
MTQDVTNRLIDREHLGEELPSQTAHRAAHIVTDIGLRAEAYRRRTLNAETTLRQIRKRLAQPGDMYLAVIDAQNMLDEHDDYANKHGLGGLTTDQPLHDWRA